jgi:hypothetical protein
MQQQIIKSPFKDDLGDLLMFAAVILASGIYFLFAFFFVGLLIK